MIKTNKDKRFCVYLHLDAEGIIRYVGSGTKARPSEFAKSSRSKRWRDFFTQPPKVVIVEDSMSKDDSISLEYFMYHACNTRNQLLNAHPPSFTRDLDLESLHELFFIDSTSKTGLRLRKDRPTQQLKSGDVAGYPRVNKGKSYWVVKVKGKAWLIHRIIYALLYGNLSRDKVIDHIDGNGLNNSISNLRLVSSQSNCLNRRPSSKNNTGISGIHKVISTYTGKIHFKVIFNSKQKKNFTVNKQGSEEKAFEAAKLFKMYHTRKVTGDDLDSVKMSQLVKYLQNEEGIAANTKPTKRKCFGWNTRINVKHVQHNIGTFPTYEQAIAARDAFVAEYNSKIKVEL